MPLHISWLTCHQVVWIWFVLRNDLALHLGEMIHTQFAFIEIISIKLTCFLWTTFRTFLLYRVNRAKRLTRSIICIFMIDKWNGMRSLEWRMLKFLTVIKFNEITNPFDLSKYICFVRLTKRVCALDSVQTQQTIFLFAFLLPQSTKYRWQKLGTLISISINQTSVAMLFLLCFFFYRITETCQTHFCQLLLSNTRQQYKNEV